MEGKRLNSKNKFINQKNTELSLSGTQGLKWILLTELKYAIENGVTL